MRGNWISKWFVGAALASAALLALAAQAQPEGPGMHERMMFSPMGMMDRLDQLNLTDQQWLAIRKILANRRSEMRSAHEPGRELHEALENLNPDSPDYAAQVQSAADQAAQLAREHVQRMADLKKQIYGVLTDAQKAQLVSLPRHRREARQ